MSREAEAAASRSRKNKKKDNTQEQTNPPHGEGGHVHPPHRISQLAAAIWWYGVMQLID